MSRDTMSDSIANTDHGYAVILMLYFNVSSACLVYLCDTNLIISASADVLEPLGARTPSGMVIITEPDIFSKDYIDTKDFE